MGKEFWIFINTFAPWLSAIGTISAVIVSLYLANKDKKIKLKVTAGYRLLLKPSKKGNTDEYLFIGIVNKWYREVQITNIGWKTGIVRKRRFVQMVIQNDGISSAMPIRLKDGEEAKYFIPLNNKTNWIDNFKLNVIKKYPRIDLHFVRIQIYTSIDKIFESRIERGLRDKLLRSN